MPSPPREEASLGRVLVRVASFGGYVRTVKGSEMLISRCGPPQQTARRFREPFGGTHRAESLRDSRTGLRCFILSVSRFREWSSNMGAGRDFRTYFWSDILALVGVGRRSELLGFCVSASVRRLASSGVDAELGQFGLLLSALHRERARVIVSTIPSSKSRACRFAQVRRTLHQWISDRDER